MLARPGCASLDVVPASLGPPRFGASPAERLRSAQSRMSAHSRFGGSVRCHDRFRDDALDVRDLEWGNFVFPGHRHSSDAAWGVLSRCIRTCNTNSVYLRFEVYTRGFLGSRSVKICGIGWEMCTRDAHTSYVVEHGLPGCQL